MCSKNLNFIFKKELKHNKINLITLVINILKEISFRIHKSMSFTSVIFLLHMACRLSILFRQTSLFIRITGHAGTVLRTLAFNTHPSSTVYFKQEKNSPQSSRALPVPTVEGGYLKKKERQSAAFSCTC